MKPNNLQPMAYDSFYDKSLGAELKFAWLPQTCNITGKRIWLKFGYRLTAMWIGPGEPFYEHKWHDKLEHIIWKLKR